MSSSVRQRAPRSDKPSPSSSTASLEPSDIRPAVPNSIIAKLLVFTLAMVTVPLGTYFLSVRTVFQGNPTFAGGLAALMANVVLMAYIFVAVRDDQAEQEEAAEGRRKGSGWKKDE
jgi:vacuolar ATPase assembly integral membrane protein VMA21